MCGTAERDGDGRARSRRRRKGRKITTGIDTEESRSEHTIADHCITQACCFLSLTTDIKFVGVRRCRLLGGSGSAPKGGRESETELRRAFRPPRDKCKTYKLECEDIDDADYGIYYCDAQTVTNSPFFCARRHFYYDTFSPPKTFLAHRPRHNYPTFNVAKRESVTFSHC